MDDVISGSLRQPRMLMHLFGGFAGLALLLAAIGTYGMLSYLVTQRRREIGIRMALGAGRETVLGSVMAHGLTLALIGLVAGLAAALVLTRLMKALLFEVSPNDPATLAGVAALITVVAAAASLVPAVRATRVDPIEVRGRGRGGAEATPKLPSWPRETKGRPAERGGGTPEGQ